MTPNEVSFRKWIKKNTEDTRIFKEQQHAVSRLNSIPNETKRLYSLHLKYLCYISILFVYLLTHSKLVLTFFGFLLFFDLNFIERKTKHTLSHISSIIRSTRRHYSTQMPGVVATEYMNLCTKFLIHSNTNE